MASTGLRIRQTFSACSIDANLPLGFRGEVHSIFSRAFNIRTEENELISVAAVEKLNGPNRILLELLRDEDFISLGLKKGMKAVGTAREISLDHGHLLISLREAKRWPPEMVVEERISSSQAQDNFFFLRKSLSIEKGEDRVSQELRVRAQELTKSIAGKNLPEVSRNVSRLIGFGKGLTPSGDDFLEGLIASLHFLNNPDFEFLLQKIKKTIKLEKDRTTLLSGKFLEYACQGRFPETVLNLIEAIFTKDREETETAARRCLDFGASSGRDTVLGIISGMAIGVELEASELE